MKTLLEHYEERALSESLREYSQENVLCLLEAAELRRQLGADGFVAWLSTYAAQLQQARQDLAGEQLWRRALNIVRLALGEQHADTAASYNNVAFNLNAQGRYEEAEPQFRQGLEIRQRVLGEEHPSTAASYNNVASNLNAQGRYEEAEPLFRQGLEISQRVLGKEHPSTAASYNNVAYNLNAQGRYEEAEPLYRQGLEIRQRVLGEEHPTTATLRSNLQSFLSRVEGRTGDAL